MGRSGHALERGRIHRTQGHVAGAVAVGAQHFCIAVGAQAQAKTGSPEGLKVTLAQDLQVFLAQVHAISAGIEGRLPMVIDKKQAGAALDRLDRCLDFAGDGVRVVALEPQLQRRHARLGHARHPLGVGKHGIQAQ